MDELIIKNLTEEIKMLREELKLLRMNMYGDVKTNNSNKKDADKSSLKDVTEEIPNEDMSSVQFYLNARKINIKSFRNEFEDDIFIQLSNYLGNRYNYLKDLYNIIKPSLSTGGSFYYNLQNKSQEIIAYTTQFCNLLYQNAFLNNYSYRKNNKIITGMPQRVGRVINFFTGGWLETYIFNFLLDVLKSKEVDDFSFVKNCQILLSNGDDFEIDILFIIKGIPVWIECKTGDYQRYISKYADFRRKLGTKTEHSILIVSDLSEGIGKNLTSTFGIKVCDLVEGKEYIEQLVCSV